jgi:heptosyltransferase II
MKILIELPTWLGDAIMATSAIENIVNFYNCLEITLVGSFISIEAIKNHPKVVKIIVLDKKYTSLYKVSRDLGGFDAFISFRSSNRTNLLKLLISSKNKYQFDKNKYKNCHQVEKYNNFIKNSLETNLPPGKLKIYGYEDIKSKEKILGINPGASYGSAKRWRPKDFAKVALELSNQYKIIIFGSVAEKDFGLDIEASLIDKGVKNYQNLVGKTSIPELINHISNLDLFITGDSGPMHLAAVFQVPTVAIFGPTKDNETSQWMNKQSIVVKKNLDCQPCMKRSCPLNHNNCMNLIEASDVLEAVKRLF